MALQRLFISLFPLFLFAYKFNIYSDINFYSDKLYFDVFSSKWKSMPSDKNINRVLDFSKTGIEYKNFGIKLESDGIIKINRGFIETWYWAREDFNTLLKRSDIGYYITTPKIYGILNYAEYYAAYFKTNSQNIRIVFNFLKGKRLDYIKVNGTNNKNRFLADLVYVYTGRNFITNTCNGGDFSGYGMGIDMSSEYRYKNFFAFLGVYNILGFIDWRGVNYMYYHFDSNTTYVGEDGYLHQKPFGVGYYKRSYSFFQKLPIFFKYNLVYNLKKTNMGSSGIFSSGNFFNMPFLEYKIKSFFIKTGYILESKMMVFGVKRKNWMIEFSKNLKLHSKALKFLLNVNF